MTDLDRVFARVAGSPGKGERRQAVLTAGGRWIEPIWRIPRVTTPIRA